MFYFVKLQKVCLSFEMEPKFALLWTTLYLSLSQYVFLPSFFQNSVIPLRFKSPVFETISTSKIVCTSFSIVNHR